MKLACVLVVSVLAVGCASTTIIRSNPSGALVRLNGAVVGRTPYTQTDTDAVVSATKSFTLEMPGYQTTTVTATKSDWATIKTVGFCVGGLFFWPVLAGLLWAPDYAQVPEVQLVPDTSVTVPPMVPPRLSVPPLAPPST
jgi:hypothetical protein